MTPPIASSTPIFATTLVGITNEQTISQHIDAYIATRNAFDHAGGKEFMSNRQVIRNAYAHSTISPEAIAKWISNLPNEVVRNEFTRRFQEWDAKIALGLLTKNDACAISEDQFFEKLEAFKQKHLTFLEGPFFADFSKAKSDLKKDLLPELKNSSVETITKRHNITDEELINRMAREWIWKAN